MFETNGVLVRMEVWGVCLCKRANYVTTLLMIGDDMPPRDIRMHVIRCSAGSLKHGVTYG
jgi:hypothetical protein